ncbi:growth/differentiation factor 15 [Dipodomys merriami]|uniref:growth/differentiation factor 15 n=1 Tax=Dipodomys merriami TaxID=94247 RepID=UPI00385580D9
MASAPEPVPPLAWASGAEARSGRWAPRGEEAEGSAGLPAPGTRRRAGRTKSGRYKGGAGRRVPKPGARARHGAPARAPPPAMPARPAPPAAPPLLALLALLALAWPPPGAARPPAARARDLRRRHQDPVRARQDGDAQAARTPAPELRLGSHGHLRLRISPAPLTRGLPAAYRAHRALVRSSPTAPEARDARRPQQREPGLRGRPRPSGPAAPPALPAPPHLRAGAARGRRSAHAHAHRRDDCPLGAGRCCRLHAVRAAPEDLGWADWLLSPPELQLRVCAGACPARYRPAGAHAQAKARLHRLRPDAVPAPCCVPADYEPVVLALRAEDGGVALRTFHDLVPRSCHCA